MGQILSRKKPSTRDTLEQLETHVLSIEDRKRLRVQREQFIVTFLLLYLPLFILVSIKAFIFFYPSDKTLRERLILTLPVIVLHVIFLGARKMTKAYYKWSAESDESRLRRLHAEKQRILDLVSETENFKTASEIFKRYDPKRLRRERKDLEPILSPFTSTFSPSPIKRPSMTAQKVHQTSQLNSTSNHIISSPSIPQPPIVMPNIFTATPAAKNSSFMQQNVSLSTSAYIAEGPRGKPLRPMISRDRSFLDKAVDWVVADGPSNRFALICQNCSSHNGMILEEEFKSLNYRCGYCFHLNPAPSLSKKISTIEESASNLDKSVSLNKTIENPEGKHDAYQKTLKNEANESRSCNEVEQNDVSSDKLDEKQDPISEDVENQQ